MIEGPIGAASFNNEFGRPAICGYFRTFEQRAAGDPRAARARLSQADHDRRRPRQRAPPARGEGRGARRARKLVVLGGPAMLIGLGGGAASSIGSGGSSADLDFASVQRGNAEIQRRAQEVIDRCWALGQRQSDRAHSRCRRRRPVERRARGRGAQRSAARASTCAPFPAPSRACRRWRSGATRRRSATCSSSRPRRCAAFARDRGARALPVRGDRRDRRHRPAASSSDPLFGNRPGRHAASTCCSASRRA